MGFLLAIHGRPHESVCGAAWGGGGGGGGGGRGNIIFTGPQVHVIPAILHVKVREKVKPTGHVGV